MGITQGGGSPMPDVAADLRARLAEAPDRVVVVEGERRFTRRELHDHALRLGSALARRGLQAGDVVAFQLPNWPEACVISLACTLHGFVVCPLMPMYREHELGFMLPRARCRVLFIPATFRNFDYPALVARTALPGLDVFTVRGGDCPGSYERLLAEPGEPAALPHLDAARTKSITFTSGTTGQPKGVLHAHATMRATALRAAAFWVLDETDRMLVPSPVGHIGGALYAFELPWLTGSAAHLMETWDPTAAITLIEREGLTFVAGATPFLRGLLEAAQATGTRLPTLRRFVCGGASVPPALVAAAAAWFETATISRAYGSTEVPLVCPGIRTRAEAPQGQTTDGEIDVDLRLLDAAGQPAAEGQEGDILARSPGMFTGYLDPADEAGQFDTDGFFRMGDIGRIVGGRFLEITGRRKEIIIRQGENISPLEIENLLLQCEAVARAAVVSVPHPRTGERAVAFVTLKPGHTLGFGEMQDALARAGLARQKFPEELHVLPDIPTNAIGKVLKAELRRLALAKPSAGSNP